MKQKLTVMEAISNVYDVASMKEEVSSKVPPSSNKVFNQVNMLKDSTLTVL